MRWGIGNCRCRNPMLPRRATTPAYRKQLNLACPIPAGWLATNKQDFSARVHIPLDRKESMQARLLFRTMASMEAIYHAKRELRASVSSKLRALDAASVKEQSESVFRLLTELPEYKRAKRVSIYLSMPSGEIDTAPMVQDAFEQGKEVYIPFTHKAEKQGPSRMDMVSLESLADYHGLKRNNWGIPTPTRESIQSRRNCLEEMKTDAEKKLDLVVVPGVAFDAECNRLGHGKGYYDYFFKRYHDQTNGEQPFTVGVALKDQFIEPPTAVPMHELDWPLDLVIVGDHGIVQRATKIGD